jgi:hypothetical protein
VTGGLREERVRRVRVLTATLWTAWEKLAAPIAPAAVPLSVTGLGALVVNFGCALMLARWRRAASSLTVPPSSQRATTFVRFDLGSGSTPAPRRRPRGWSSRGKRETTVLPMGRLPDLPCRIKVHGEDPETNDEGPAKANL